MPRGCPRALRCGTLAALSLLARCRLSKALLPALGISCASAPGIDTPRGPTPNDAWVSAPEHEPRGAEAGPAVRPIAPVALETCGHTRERFEGWLASFRRHAVAQKISEKTVAIALDDVRYDPDVIALDRSQAAFKLSFEEFSARRVTRARITRGKELLRKHAALLGKIEARFGVPPEVLVAIWGLETDFGENAGSRSCLRALATLAYDCRRSALFRGELMSALRIVERGDLGPADMVGAWAGELGQTQFLPSSYERYALDFDGDGRADLVGSSADALASTASYLEGHGWKAREGYKPGTANFAVLGTWNASEVYRKTIALFASKLAVKRR
jgi:membrane-bound lytic murein transglycosylase B